MSTVDWSNVLMVAVLGAKRNPFIITGGDASARAYLVKGWWGKKWRK